MEIEGEQAPDPATVTYAPLGIHLITGENHRLKMINGKMNIASGHIAIVQAV